MIDLEAWLISHRNRAGVKLWEVLGISRMHLYRIQAGQVVPSYDLAERIAALMAKDGTTAPDGQPYTAGQILDAQARRLAARVGDKGRTIWPHAPWAKKLEESKS